MTPAPVRTPVAAGTFYPDDPTELAATVDGLLAAATVPALDGEPRGLVVPHAGYVYSGPVAAAGYAAMSPGVRRVAVFGPSHFVPLEGCAVSGSEAWTTPLGAVEVDGELREATGAAGARVDDAPHRQDHALEVQLPFLARRLGADVRIAPVAVGWSGPEEVAEVMRRVAEAGAFLVVSTDLSHYLPQDLARRADAGTAGAILDLDVDTIGPDAACGAFALRGLVALARATGGRFVQLDLRTSGDTAGDHRSVVGYGAFALLRA